ncbi:prepilin peptidase [Patescibacteria group bacterium]|nr:prepilin peptidase [Patescibacteria group bacterium]
MFEAFLVFAVFAFGLIIGSFLNVVLYRLAASQGLESSLSSLPKSGTRLKTHDRRFIDTSPFRGRSACPLCGHRLSWKDLVPLVSFFWLKGKCCYCNGPISWQYPLVEFATGLFFVAALFILPCLPCSEQGFARLVYVWAVGAFLIAIFVYDLKHYLIPDKLLYSAIGLAFLWRIFEQFGFGFWVSMSLIQAVLAGLGACAFFFAIHFFSRGRAMGFGDVKLAFFMGLFLGWPSILVALFFAFLLGAVVGVFLMVAGRKGWKSEVPFGPFLILGTATAFFWGQEIFYWYLNLLVV